MAEKEAGLSPDNSPPRSDGRRHWGRKVLIIVAVIIFFVVLALGLGLGLGLGLKRDHHVSNSPAQPSSTSTPSTGGGSGSSNNYTQDMPSWRRDTQEYALDMDTWDINAAPTTRIYNFTLSVIQAAPDGVVRDVLAINGQFPGPLIRMNRGDRLLVNVTNAMPNATTLHWHGMYQNGTNWMDGTTGITQCPIPPGQSFLYNFTVPNQYGTYWYHSHYSTQYTDGLVGPLIIHAPEEAETRKQYDFDQVILVQDWYHDFTAGLLPGYLASGNENIEPVPDNGLMQGTNYFDCSSYGSDSGYTCQDNSTRAFFAVEQGKRYRLRLINTGAFAEFEISVDNHTLAVIEADGVVTEPYPVHRLEIAIAQRYSVILTANQTATNYWMRYEMVTFCFGEDNPVLDPNGLTVISYTNSTASPDDSSVDWTDAYDVICEDLNATNLVPVVQISPPPADVFLSIAVSFQIGDYALDRAFINSTTWVAAVSPTINQAISGLQSGNSSFTSLATSAPNATTTAFGPNQFVFSVPGIQIVDLLVTNFDDGVHPFHLHGHTFWILATSATGYFDYTTYGSLNTSAPAGNPNPMRRDTMSVDAYGWALIRFVSDNPGMWAFHCHISWHLQAGLMMQFMAQPEVMSGWQLPSDVADLCVDAGAGAGNSAGG